MVLNAVVQTEDVDVLKRFWELEAEPKLNKQQLLTQEEQACEDHFQATTRRDETGRYIVELPFRCPDPPCKFGNSRNIAMKRLFSLERKLSKDVNAREQYTEVLKEYVSLNHMERISEESEKEKEDAVWLPHHAVIRMDKTTTKTRVVFNASSKGTNGVSLNDTLMVGPTLQPDLRHIVLRWRLYPICLTADIIKMYRQVRVADKHTDYQRILWRLDPNGEIEDYRLLTVTFGTASAPYLAVKALQQTAVDEGHKYPLAAERAKSDFYMDDLMPGCHSETEAIEIYRQMNEMLKKGGKDDVLMELHGFSDASNVAYAAVVYARIIDADGNIHTQLVTAKTKVAPIKQVSVPRLELCGAVLVAKLLEEVAEVLNIDRKCFRAWTDSTVVLAWLCAHPGRWKTIVANRTVEILSKLDSQQWSYVQSKQNPADCASRGVPASALVDNQLWMQGPEWLRCETIIYSKPSSIATKTDLEERSIKAHTTTTGSDDSQWWSRFSSLGRLVRVVAYCRRFLQLRIKPKSKFGPYLSPTEIEASLMCCIRQCQREFSKEIQLLSNKEYLSTKN
ncbi:uncharacterized protein LOC126381618 [Pectinophora gossypiella]|uniref:uncharacterized protein LOC126381618 n=1 Tax=Pectinophora gossypiella TaxID=13191 RepID=UPI00214E5A03|nr:uncharacterized protein LOC126381618 [Pectinophora gossypiella]